LSGVATWSTIVPEPIETRRLILEPLRFAHAEEMVDVLADWQLYSFTGGTPPSLPALQDRYARQVVGRSPGDSERWFNWILRVRSTQAAAGYVQATVVEAPAEVVAFIAWLTGVRHQRLGYAGEAATAMAGWLRSRGVGQLIADVHPEHLASIAVARRLGLTATGEIVDGELRWAGAG